MTNEINTTDSANLAHRKRATSVDPVLAELWAIKKQINEEANFSVDTIVARASSFTIEGAWARVRAARNAAQLSSHH